MGCVSGSEHGARACHFCEGCPEPFGGEVQGRAGAGPRTVSFRPARLSKMPQTSSSVRGGGRGGKMGKQSLWVAVLGRPRATRQRVRQE